MMMQMDYQIKLKPVYSSPADAIELWTEAAFMRALEATVKRIEQPIPKGRYKHCLAFMKLKAYRTRSLLDKVRCCWIRWRTNCEAKEVRYGLQGE